MSQGRSYLLKYLAIAAALGLSAPLPASAAALGEPFEQHCVPTPRIVADTQKLEVAIPASLQQVCRQKRVRHMTFII